MQDARGICERVRSSDQRIRHVGYYDEFGRILYDSIRENTQAMEGIEEQHILNGRVATMLSIWKPADSIIGKIEGFVMIREKLVALILPEGNNYFLVVFEAGTPLETLDKIRIMLLRETLS